MHGKYFEKHSYNPNKHIMKHNIQYQHIANGLFILASVCFFLATYSVDNSEAIVSSLTASLASAYAAFLGIKKLK